MSLWTDIARAVAGAASRAIAGVVEAVRTIFEGDPLTRRRVAFSIAMIALSAKMAKADGVVTDSEVRAFRQIFHIPDHETRHVERLYNLAKQDVTGFEAYARQLAGLCSAGERDCPMLEDVLDGLFHIAGADGALHDREIGFLSQVAGIFGISETHFESILARHGVRGEGDPYKILGVTRGDSVDEVRRAYRRLAAENHPDRLIARGVPQEFIAIANRRMAAINAAYSAIARGWQPA